MNKAILAALAGSLIFHATPIHAKPNVSEHVLQAHKAMAEELNMADQTDFEIKRFYKDRKEST